MAALVAIGDGLTTVHLGELVTPTRESITRITMVSYQLQTEDAHPSRGIMAIMWLIEFLWEHDGS